MNPNLISRPTPHTEPRPSPRHKDSSPLTPGQPCAAVCTARGHHQARASHLRGVVRRQEHRVPETRQPQGIDPASTSMQHISTLDHTAHEYTQCDRCAYAGLVSMQCRSTAHMRRLTDACMHRGRRRRPRSRRPRRRRLRSRTPWGRRPRSKRRRSAPPLPPHHLSESQRAHDPQLQRAEPDPDTAPTSWPRPRPIPRPQLR